MSLLLLSGRLTGTGAGSEASVLARSSMTAANGTPLGSVVNELGGSWVAQNGSWEAQSNRAVTTGVVIGSGYIATLPALVSADARIEAVVIPGSGGGGGLIFRYSDVDNNARVSIDESANTLNISENEGGIYNTVASTSFPIVAGTPYRVTAVFAGSRVTAYLDGIAGPTHLFLADTTSKVVGLHGGFAAGSAAFDDFIALSR